MSPQIIKHSRGYAGAPKCHRRFSSIKGGARGHPNVTADSQALRGVRGGAQMSPQILKLPVPVQTKEVVCTVVTSVYRQSVSLFLGKIILIGDHRLIPPLTAPLH